MIHGSHHMFHRKDIALAQIYPFSCSGLETVIHLPLRDFSSVGVDLKVAGYGRGLCVRLGFTLNAPGESRFLSRSHVEKKAFYALQVEPHRLPNYLPYVRVIYEEEHLS